jgi:hypothetical protein
MSGKTGKPDSPGPPSTPPGQPPSTPPGKKKVKIRKGGKWVDVDADSEIKKGRFKYVKFVDDDGLDTYWISPE